MRRVVIALATAALAVPAMAAGHGKSDSGIRGRVWIYPTCPGPAPYPPSEQCGPKGLEARINVHALPSHDLVKVIHTGKQGRFHAALAPGSYRLWTRSESSYPGRGCPATKLTVAPHAYRRVDITCDSGIR